MTGSKLKETYPPVHPGEILQEEFMEPHGLSAYSVAAELGVDRGSTGSQAASRPSPRIPRCV